MALALTLPAAPPDGGAAAGFELMFSSGGGGLDEHALESDALALLTDDWLDEAPLLCGAPVSPGSEGGSGGSTECVAPPWRCLDASHGAGCAACTPPPAASDEASYELRAKDGRKNGEKRLRGALARCAEWLSHESRCAAAECVEGRPRLAAALRARHIIELRKSDLIHLCRLWGYRSDVWAHRKDGRPPLSRRPAAAAAAAPAPAPAPPLEQRLQLHGAPGARDLQLAAPGGALGTVQSLLACTMTPLARAAAASFANTERSAWLVARLAAAPPAQRPMLCQAVAHKARVGGHAAAVLAGVAATLRDAHEATQGSLLLLSPQEGAREACMALISGAADARVAAAESALPVLLQLCQRAVTPACAFTLPPPAAGAPPEVLPMGDVHISAGLRASIDLVGHLARLLRELQLCSYETYLSALGPLLSLLIGHVATTRAAMGSHLALLGGADGAGAPGGAAAVLE